MTQDEMKKAAGWAALKYVVPGTIVGVGTGSTVNHFIDALATMKDEIKGAVSSSVASTERLKGFGIQVFDLNDIDALSVYVDGADEINASRDMIKGGGAALTREKIVAAVADKFICIIDNTKTVDVLGQFPLPVEVIPMAREYVAREIRKLGGNPVWREGVVHRQRQHHTGRQGHGHRGCQRAGSAAQRHRRRGYQRPVRPPWRGRGTDRHAGRRGYPVITYGWGQLSSAATAG